MRAKRLHPSRRSVLTGLSALTGALASFAFRPRSARATPDQLREAVRSFTGGAQLRDGRVRVDIPALVENGNVVPLNVTVESPMTAEDHVRRIHVLNEKNPQPHVITAHLGPRAGRASLSTRIRLSDTQKLMAIAEMSDGSYWSGSADVVVTIAACVED